MRRGAWVAALGLSLLIGCSADPTFVCGDAGDCLQAGWQGTCEPTGFCSFPDADCPSGSRYGDLAGGGFAGRCVEDESETEATSSSTSTTTTGSTSTTTGPATGSSTSSGTSTTAVTASGTDSSTTQSETTGGSTSESTATTGGGVTAASCAQLLALDPQASSGPTMLDPLGDGNLVEVHCDMERFGGGWTRVASVDPAQGCPGEWVQESSPSVCSRGNATSAANFIRTAQFSIPIASYREVMGYVRGLQYASMDTFTEMPSLSEAYVDGVSITRDAGNGPVHVWTYAVAWSDDDPSENSLCPCLGGDPAPGFVGSNFYCESGRTGGNVAEPVWYEGDPLWDGDGTGTDCNTDGDPSYFQRDFGEDLTDSIEVRLMADQSTNNEDVGVTGMELYVR